MKPGEGTGSLNRDPTSTIQSISAVTLAVEDMARAVGFYLALGFELLYGGQEAAFSSFAVGTGYLNLIAQARSSERPFWGRVIFYVSDVDAFYRNAVADGLRPKTAPRDAEWRERYFHIVDPEGHELSFAKPLE